MAVRLAAAFGTSSPEVWLRMQAKYDLWQISKRGMIRVTPLPRLQHS
jgi:plasmid maintenance system antidote protein VapI